MSGATFTHLRVALLDQCLWVRLGAARALVSVSPEGSSAVLLEHWTRIRRAAAQSNPFEEDQAIELFSLAACLEWSRIDSKPLLIDVFGGSLDAVLRLMEGDRDLFVEFLNSPVAELPPYLTFRARRLCVELRSARQWRLWQLREPPEREEPMTPHAIAASNLKRDWMGVATKTVLSETFGSITKNLLSMGAADRASGVQQLIRIALTDGRWHIRNCAMHALPVLRSDGSFSLLAALCGRSPVTLTDAEIARLAQEASKHNTFRLRGASPNDRERMQEALLAYLSSEALERFTDAPTASALTTLAISDDPVAAERAVYVLLRMQVDVCAPLLFFASVNAPLHEAREAAFSVLASVLNGRSRGEHALRKIGLQKLDTSTSLDWILELRQRCQALPDWASDPSTGGSLCWSSDREATKLLLGAALILTPQIEGENRTDITYYSPPLWDRFTGYLEQLRAVARREKTPASIVSRQPVVDFPSRCLHGTPAQLSLHLAPHISGGMNATDNLSVRFEQGKDHASLLVVVESTGFSVMPGHQVLHVPQTGTSETIRFTLVPTRPGDHAVELGFFRGAERIGYYTVNSRVVEDTAWNRTVQSVSVERAKIKAWDGIHGDDLRRRGSTRAVVFVDSAADGTMEFRLLDPAIGPEPLTIGKSPVPILPSQVSEWVACQNELVRSFLIEECPTDLDLQGAIMGLRAVGFGLFQQLVPASLTPRLEALPDGATVAIESNAHWVPWELLATRAAGPLLGERFQLIRIPRKPVLANDSLFDVVPLESTIDTGTPIQRVLAVIGDEVLTGSQTHSTLTAHVFGAAAPIVRGLLEGTLKDLHSEVKDADIVHFTCHGRSPPYHLSLGPGLGRRFFVKQVQTLDLKPGAVVFANACSSAQSSLMLAELENIGFEFYLRGARPFLGTLGPVPRDDALCIARLFYAAFIGEGLSAGEALAKTRREAAKVLKRPTWMFYCLIGPASARRVAPIFPAIVSAN